MKSPRSHQRRFRKKHGNNSGACRGCGTKANWRSISDLCWRCELERINKRNFSEIDPEILASLAKVDNNE